ncbi:unnamed protein product [Schistocephalus solidus]|uniref:Cystatin domain-containing protein n=1 Tax=Schistocephalus solidus TaxID=70667 RepID=A0A183TN85_SCHSO|nr:unnamed protein product [Schistocephalus solidus]
MRACMLIFVCVDLALACYYHSLEEEETATVVAVEKSGGAKEQPPFERWMDGGVRPLFGGKVPGGQYEVGAEESQFMRALNSSLVTLRANHSGCWEFSLNSVHNQTAQVVSGQLFQWRMNVTVAKAADHSETCVQDICSDGCPEGKLYRVSAWIRNWESPEKKEIFTFEDA